MLAWLRWVRLGCLSLAMVGLAHAGNLEFKGDTANRLTYFDLAESAPAYHVLQVDPDETPAGIDVVFSLDAGATPGAVLCVNVYEITEVSKALLSSRRTVLYNKQLVNASRLRSLRALTPAEKQALGFDADEAEDIGRLELQDGVQLNVLTPSHSHYFVCQVQGQQVSTKAFVPTDRFMAFKRKVVDGKANCTRTKGKTPTLGPARSATRFVIGPEAAALLQACQAQDAAETARMKEQADQKVRERQEANARYEAAKAQHPMVPGVEILAKLGANRAERLVYDCQRSRFFSTFEPMSKEEERNRYCMGYYPEEVEGLQREMRVRGLVRD